MNPVIVNLFMDLFEEYQPATWFRYVDDTFVIWGHGIDKLNDFLQHLNSQHPSIQFTMETEKEQQLALLVLVLVRGRAHTVYRKPTHTDRYLHALSNYNPCQKYGVIRTLTEPARRICEPENLQAELEHLKTAFKANGYSMRVIERSMEGEIDARNIGESSDTESADLRPKDTKRIVTPIKLKAIFKKNKGKVDSEGEQRSKEGENGGDDSEEKNDADNASTATAPVDDGKGLVYAELDLVRTDLKPVLKNEDEKTEYAEIVYTPKTEDDKENNSGSPKMEKSPIKDKSPKK